MSNRQLLSLTDAGGRLMYAYEDLAEVVGLTGRTLELRNVDVRIPSLPLLPPAPAPKSLKSFKDEDIPAGSKQEMERSTDHLSGSETTLIRAVNPITSPHTAPHDHWSQRGREREEGWRELQGILETTHLGYPVETGGGNRGLEEWMDVFSGGEAEDGAFARALASAKVRCLGWYIETTHLILSFFPNRLPSCRGGGSTGTGDLTRVLEEIKTLEGEFGEAEAWAESVRELEEALKPREGIMGMMFVESQ
ncbi:hypothetical protein BU15DRAFT_64305 [Melanogaster broomeanus]|nr:hypothetical protein BU15DRAFT_64305 [Melanogaster broomeanus]